MDWDIINGKLKKLENENFTEEYFLDFFNAGGEILWDPNRESEFVDLECSEEDMEEEIESLIDILIDNFGLLDMKRGDKIAPAGNCYHLLCLGALDKITNNEDSGNNRIRIRFAELHTSCSPDFVYIGYALWESENDDGEMEGQSSLYVYQSGEELRPDYEEIMDDLQYSADDLEFDDEDE